MKGRWVRGWKHTPKEAQCGCKGAPVLRTRGHGKVLAGPGWGWAQPGNPREGKALLCGRAKWGRVQTLGQSRARQGQAESMGTEALDGHSLRRRHCSPGISKGPSEKDRAQLGICHGFAGCPPQPLDTVNPPHPGPCAGSFSDRFRMERGFCRYLEASTCVVPEPSVSFNLSYPVPSCWGPVRCLGHRPSPKVPGQDSRVLPGCCRKASPGRDQPCAVTHLKLTCRQPSPQHALTLPPTSFSPRCSQREGRQPSARTARGPAPVPRLGPSSLTTHRLPRMPSPLPCRFSLGSQSDPPSAPLGRTALSPLLGSPVPPAAVCV